MSVVANVAINVDSRNAVSKLRQVQSQSQATERAVGGLGAALGKLAVAAAALQAARFVFAKTAELESQTRSLQVLTGSAEKAGRIIKELQQLGAVTPFTSTELIDSAKRLQAFGVETNKVVETTRRLADVSGATGAELQGLVTAYGQVQAKGKLQGEELLQFQERGVALQQILKEEYKLSGEEFQDALSKGKISAEAVEVAIQKLTEAGGKYANGAIAQSDTLNGKLSTLQDSFQRLAQNIGTFFAPVFKFLIDGINAFIERVNNAARIGAEARAYEEANRRTRTRFGALRYANPFDQEVQQYRERLRKSLVQSELGAGAMRTAPTAAAGALPPLGAGTAGAGGGRGRAGGVDKAAREAEKLAQEIQRSIELGDRLGTEFSRQVLLLGEANEIEQKRLRIQFDYEDRAKQIAELKNEEQRINLTDLNNEIKRLEILGLQTDELKKQLEEYYKRAGLKLEDPLGGGAGAFRTDISLMPGAGEQQMAKYREELEALTNPIDMAVTGANAIGDAFGTAFQNIATGAKSTQEALADAFKSISSAFISMATEIIAKQMAMIVFQTILKALGGGSFGFSGAGPAQLPSGASFAEGFSMPSLIPGRASGGPVSAGSPYIVGERGPELFVPGRSGAIVPNDKMGGDNVSVVVNVDAKGTNVQGNDQQGNQLGRAISAAVQQELVKQKRPGGLLA